MASVKIPDSGNSENANSARNSSTQQSINKANYSFDSADASGSRKNSGTNIVPSDKDVNIQRARSGTSVDKVCFSIKNTKNKLCLSLLQTNRMLQR